MDSRMRNLTLRSAMRAAVLGACLVALGGCMHATRSEVSRHYDLGPLSTTTAASDHATRRSDEVLRVLRITTPPWLAGTAMHYRLHYGDDHGLAAYANSDWIAPPATLLEPVIEHTLAASGAWRAVIGPGNPATADASLRIRLDDFSQGFSSPGNSAAVIDATATLVDNHGDTVIAQQRFRVDVAAPTPDARGGAAALAAAGTKLSIDLQHWLQDSTAEQPATRAAR